MSAPPSVFNYSHFVTVVTYLGLSSFLHPAFSSLVDSASAIVGFDSNFDWLVTMFYSCQAPVTLAKASDTDNTLLIAAAANSYDLLLYWALFELAKFCINSKLKTPLGAPVQTLESLEECLEQYSLLKSTVNFTSDISFDICIMERCSHFVLFLELLEVQMQSAASGCSSIIPSPPKSSILFFNANMGVCHDWISRIRYKVVLLASFYEDDSLVVRYSYKVIYFSDH
jgi:hypothetical protein